MENKDITGEKFKVLSLFDGMSCGQIALNRAGIKYDNYFASEIDKYAIQVTQANYPNTIQIGDVRNIIDLDLPKINMLIGGSPCQGFSFAGKQLNFEDPRSKLFFEFVRLKNELNPEVFLLENVRMKKEHQRVISDLLGVEPIEINSALVSAQSRRRLYWTNIKGIEQPNDKGIYLKDILQNEVDEKYYISENTANRARVQTQIREKHQKSFCLAATMHKGAQSNGMTCVKMVGRRLDENGLRKDYSDNPVKQILEPAPEGKSNCLTTVEKDNLIFNRSGHPKKEQLKAACLTVAGNSGGNHSDMDLINCRSALRRLTPIECERLQTVPDNYTNFVSDTQRYKMLGNGWTVDVITHIFETWLKKKKQ